jgi:hypothetical protein
MADYSLFYLIFVVIGVIFFYYFFIKPNREKHINELYIKLISEINNFPNTRIFDKEQRYHDTLHGYLLHEFPLIKYESQIDDSRPDLVLGNQYIAIEVKGPTGKEQLDNVYYIKCKKYSKLYKYIIIVLFNVNVTDKSLKKFYHDMHEDYPHVHIIIKKHM